jgi:general stress protein 26
LFSSGDATYEIPGMTREETERFLGSELNLQIATIDEKGEPNIQPVWFYYDKDEEKLLMTTSKLAKKTQNLKRKPTIYFSIDYENYDKNLPLEESKVKVLRL